MDNISNSNAGIVDNDYIGEYCIFLNILVKYSKIYARSKALY